MNLNAVAHISALVVEVLNAKADPFLPLKNPYPNILISPHPYLRLFSPSLTLFSSIFLLIK